LTGNSTDFGELKSLDENQQSIVSTIKNLMGGWKEGRQKEENFAGLVLVF
jgi:hypothetical protein